jgi:hypothetical protein
LRIPGKGDGPYRGWVRTLANTVINLGCRVNHRVYGEVDGSRAGRRRHRRTKLGIFDNTLKEMRKGGGVPWIADIAGDSVFHEILGAADARGDDWYPR